MPLSNFGQIDDYVFRSAQPDADAWLTLRRLRVKAAVKLNDETEYPRAKEATEAGPTVQIAAAQIDQWHPNKTDVYGIAQVVEDFASHGTRVLVHCTHGRDRTGLVIGAWRLIHCGWTLDQVQAERRTYGVTGIVVLADHEITECLESIAAEQRH